MSPLLLLKEERKFLSPCSPFYYKSKKVRKRGLGGLFSSIMLIFWYCFLFSCRFYPASPFFRHLVSKFVRKNEFFGAHFYLGQFFSNILNNIELILGISGNTLQNQTICFNMISIKCIYSIFFDKSSVVYVGLPSSSGCPVGNVKSKLSKYFLNQS